ncbi:CAP domain-containing protein [Streptomyces sp. NPDC051133]|uniref:CAP domain-containing protein n=1 Tax=Streptomyces sp. NPDC051133 TaxID=3155521 RepID=UPI0034169CE7
MTVKGRALSMGCFLLAALVEAVPIAWAEPAMPGSTPSQLPQWHVLVPSQWEPQRDSPAQNSAPPGTAADPTERVAAEINRRRAEAGCAPVRVRASLHQAAQVHSVDMARHVRLTHTGTDGSDPADRMRAAGYRPEDTGEAVVVGPVTAGAAVTEWMNSPPHRAIILTCRYTDAGVGVASGIGGPWWTLDLATRL